MDSCDGSTTILHSLKRILPVVALIVTGFTLGGCYTQFGSEKGDYWNYTGKPQAKAEQPKAVDSLAPAPQRMTLLDTIQPQPATTTVINNYYYDDTWDGPWWDRYRWEHYYRHRHPGLTIVIGDPYWADPWHPAYYYGHRHYDDWYWCDDYWGHRTYRGPGWVSWDPYYPYPPYPFYGCMPPDYYYDYAWGYYPYWYGPNYYGPHYGSYGSYGSDAKPNARRGRIGGGERRASEETPGNGRIDRTAPLGDARNTPVHVSGPDDMSSDNVRAATEPTPVDPDVSRTEDTKVPDRQPMRAGEGVRQDASTESTATQPGYRQPQKQTPKENTSDPGAVQTPTRSRAPENVKPDDGQAQHPIQPKHAEPRQEPAKDSYAPATDVGRPEQQAREPERSTPARDAGRSDEGRSNESRPTRTDSGSSNNSDRNSNDNTRSSGRAR